MVKLQSDFLKFTQELMFVVNLGIVCGTMLLKTITKEIRESINLPKLILFPIFSMFSI